MTLAIVLYLLVGVVVVVASQWHPDGATRDTARDTWPVAILLWPVFLLFLLSHFGANVLRRIGLDRERDA